MRTATTILFAAALITMLGGPEAEAGSTAATPIGAAAPALSLAAAWNGLGADEQVSAFLGQPVVIKFWSPRCGPCRRELPRLQKLHESYTSRGLRIIAISLADEASTRRFASQQGFTFPIGIDRAGATRARYGVRAIPTTVLIDVDGNVRSIGSDLKGAIEAELDEMRRRSEAETTPIDPDYPIIADAAPAPTAPESE